MEKESLEKCICRREAGDISGDRVSMRREKPYFSDDPASAMAWGVGREPHVTEILEGRQPEQSKTRPTWG